MTLTLPPELQRFVQEQIAGGHYPTQDGVIEAGLRLLIDQQDELRSLIAAGVEQADRGDVGPFDPIATLSEVRTARQQKLEG